VCVGVGVGAQAALAELQAKQTRKIGLHSRVQSDREEWISLRYDGEYDADVAYHMDIDWYVAAGRAGVRAWGSAERVRACCAQVGRVGLAGG
jgi:hypothetical protein